MGSVTKRSTPENDQEEIHAQLREDMALAWRGRVPLAHA